MATVVNFGGRQCIEPGAYATTVYTPTSVVNVAQFGNVMIIDTGNDPNYTRSTKDWQELGVSLPAGVTKLEFSGGAGINGESAKGGKAVYEFDAIEDFRDFLGGGELAAIAEKLFTPRSGAAGAPKVFYTRAAKTTPAQIGSLELDTQIDLEITLKNEGILGNGVLSNGVLKVGYAVDVVGNASDGYTMRIHRGNFGGYDSAGDRINGYSWETAFGEVIAESPVLMNNGSTAEFIQWCKTDPTLNAIASINRYAEEQNFTTINAKTLTAFTGGTTTYLDGSSMSDVMDAIEEMDITFFLATNMSIDGATDSATNAKIFTHIKTQARYGSILFVPAGEGDDDLFGTGAGTSQSVAKYYNDAKVVVVHGAPETARLDNPRDVKQLPTVYLAAAIMGLNAGMAAQTPITFKQVGYNAFKYDLKRKEREKALQAGIMHVRNVNGSWCVNQGITSLQDNLQTYDPQGNSMELSIELIKAQVNKELMIDAQTRFTGQNAAQASPESVKNFTETKLQSLVAERGADNLILNWKNVKVTTKNSDYYINYDFVPNVPVNKLFFVGNVLDFTVSA